MNEQKHIIKRQTIDLTVKGALDARRLQDEVSRIYRQRIVPLIDQYCSELSEPNRLHRIESLVLDVGVLDTQRLEAELVAQVSAALRPALATRIGEQERGPGQDTRAMSQLELFALFARTGSLPWWADASTPRLLEDCLEHLVRHAPEPLRRLMRELAHEQGLLRRIINHTPDRLLAMLAGILTPAVQASSAPAPQSLIDLLQEMQAAAGRGPAQLKRSVWSNILHVAGLGGQHYPTAGSFYQAVLKRVAADLGTAYAALLSDMQQSWQSGREGISSEVKNLLATLDEARPGVDITSGEALAPPSNPERDGSTQTIAKPAVDQLPPKVAHQDVPPEELSKLTHRLRRAANAEHDPSTAPVESTAALHFSAADELYIGNAGLVILWPFLGHFFTRLGLLEGKQFKDLAVRQRAAGLLQYIAAEDMSFPEYLLPLNKVLCGLELAEVFDFGPPLLDAEAAECTNLLAAAIAQTPILGDMSAPGFRSTFLLRQAVLGTRDGAWLLRVERQSYDIVLDRFPWSWQWVKLPWMAAPLRVEW